MLKPSTYKPHAIWFSRDPALNAPVRGDESDDAWKKIETEWDRKVAQARETGYIAPILVEGQTPTTFTVTAMPAEALRKALDRFQAGRIGSAELAALVFRACVTSVSNFDGYEVKTTRDPDYGRLATSDLVQKLDEIDPAIVGELGNYLFGRATNPNPK